MNIIPGDVIIDAPRTPPPGKSQPIEAIAAPEAELDDAAVREAISKAEANNQDPQTITLDEFAQGKVNTPPEAPKPAVAVPEKFLKSDGAVDVDKIKASTQALDEAIANRDPIPQKTVDDYMTEYREKEKLFRAQTLPKQEMSLPPAAPLPQEQNPTEYEEIVRRDYAADPLGTTTRLMNLMIENKFQPIAEREKIEERRTNLQKLAEKDPRVLREDVFKAINAKLQEEPDLLNRKNPHKAAWLEVKDEMRLGDYTQSPAQPSRPLSPVLGGGTPPSAPLSSVPSSNGSVDLNALDLRDKKQEELGDEAIRRQLMGNRG